MATFINDLNTNIEAKKLYFNADITAAQTAGTAINVFDDDAHENAIAVVNINALTAQEGDFTFTIATCATSNGDFVSLGTVQITSANAGTPQVLRLRNYEKFIKVTLAQNTAETTIAVVPAFVSFVGVKERV